MSGACGQARRTRIGAAVGRDLDGARAPGALHDLAVGGGVLLDRGRAGLEAPDGRGRPGRSRPRAAAPSRPPAATCSSSATMAPRSSGSAAARAARARTASRPDSTVRSASEAASARSSPSSGTAGCAVAQARPDGAHPGVRVGERRERHLHRLRRRRPGTLCRAGSRRRRRGRGQRREPGVEGRAAHLGARVGGEPAQQLGHLRGTQLPRGLGGAGADVGVLGRRRPRREVGGPRVPCLRQRHERRAALAASSGVGARGERRAELVVEEPPGGGLERRHPHAGARVVDQGEEPGAPARRGRGLRRRRRAARRRAAPGRSARPRRRRAAGAGREVGALAHLAEAAGRPAAHPRVGVGEEAAQRRRRLRAAARAPGRRRRGRGDPGRGSPGRARPPAPSPGP